MSGLSVAEAGRARTEEYRRRKDTAVLAIVFADIADSTPLLEDLGENRYDELREGHNQRVREVVEKDDAGCVVQFYGDGALAVFSEPSTAVERCLRLVKVTQDACPFCLRVGIDVGQVARKSNGGTVLEVFGRHVNRAARIQSLAEPGHVLTSYSVYDFAVGWLRSAGVEWKPLGRITPKGFNDEISIHEPFVPGSVDPQEPLPSRASARSGIYAGKRGRLLGAMRPARRARRARGALESVVESGLDELPTPELEASAGVLKNFPDVPPRAVRSGEDPFDYYRRALGTNAVRARGSLTRRMRAFLGGRTSAPSLLWVDDHPENNRLLQDIMEAAGCRVTNALDTEQAIDHIRGAPLDLIITDMGRGEDHTAGLTLLARIRESGLRRPTIVFASPRAVAEHAEQARGLGAIECTAGTVQLLKAVSEQIQP